MLKYLPLAPILLIVSVADAQPARTEFVRGSGLVWASPVFVEFAVDASQADPEEPVGWMVAAFDAFPQHEFMTFESTELTSIAVDKRTALLTGTALVIDDRSGFRGEVEFSAIFEDNSKRRRNRERDRLSLTLYFPTGAETFSGTVASGGLEVGRRRR